MLFGSAGGIDLRSLFQGHSPGGAIKSDCVMPLSGSGWRGLRGREAFQWGARAARGYR